MFTNLPATLIIATLIIDSGIEYVPDNLELYSRPKYYMGLDFEGYYKFISNNRDSSILTRSNWQSITSEFDKFSLPYENWGTNHWACGWLDTMMIYKDDTASLVVADIIVSQLQDYPLYDEDHYSTLEFNEATELWESMSEDERAYYLDRANLDPSMVDDYMPCDLIPYLV